MPTGTPFRDQPGGRTPTLQTFQMAFCYTTTMPPTPIVVLEIDDNTPASEPPISYEVSMWSFRDDLNLATRAGDEVFREMHKAVDSSRFRGYPDRAAQRTVELFDAFVEPSEVTWLTANELGRERSWLPRDHREDEVHRTRHGLFAAIDAVASQFGADCVRLVFAFV